MGFRYGRVQAPLLSQEDTLRQQEEKFKKMSLEDWVQHRNDLIEAEALNSLEVKKDLFKKANIAEATGKALDEETLAEISEQGGMEKIMQDLGTNKDTVGAKGLSSIAGLAGKMISGSSAPTNTAASVGGGMLEGAATGATIGNLPGAVIGGVVGGIKGLLTSSAAKEKEKEDTRKRAESQKEDRRQDAFANLISSFRSGMK